MTARKTAPARARKATPPARKAAPETSRDQHHTTEVLAAPDETPEVPEGEIMFQGRSMRVRMPTPEQILIWKRTMDRLEQANLNDWNGEQVLAALDRTRKIVDSVLPDQQDIDWIDDQMLDKKFGLKEASQIVLDALAAFQNRDQRRATKAAARRKK